MYATRLAYRHADGSVEGFVGYGFTLESSDRDCLNQMRRKVEIALPGATFDATRVIRDDKKLSEHELQSIRLDWTSHLRY